MPLYSTFKQANNESNIEFLMQGKVLRQKNEKKSDWKEKMTKGILNAGEKLKVEADRVSYRIRRWWQSKKTEWQKSSQSGKAEL